MAIETFFLPLGLLPLGLRVFNDVFFILWHERIRRRISLCCFCTLIDIVTPTWLMDMQLVRTVALLNVDAVSLSNFGSIWRVHSCTFTTGVATDFTFAPSRFIFACKISRCRGSASVSIWFRDRDTHDSFVVAARIVLLDDQSSAEIQPTPNAKKKA